MRHLVIALLLLTVVSSATATTARRGDLRLHHSIMRRAETFNAIQVTSFGEVQELARSCETTTDPQPMDTPNPMLNGKHTIKVDVIVGWDGKIYSPFLLMSAGEPSDHQVLRTVSSWRFRPATCNGIPVNAEDHITFRQ